jgi:hypothetical protein
MTVRNVILGILLLLPGISAWGQNRYWIATVDGSSWTDGANWSTTTGGVACNCVPAAANTAIFDGAGGRNGGAQLPANTTVGAIQITAGYTGAIDLNGFNLSTGALAANNTFLGGSITGTGNLQIVSTRGANFTGTDLGPNVTLTATLTTNQGIFTGGAGTTFNGTVTVTAFSIRLHGATYESTTTLTKTGTTADLGDGGNTFNGVTTFIHDGDGQWITANINPDTFNGELHLSLTGANQANKLRLAYAAAGNEFNADIRISSLTVANAELSFGANGGSSTFADGVTIEEEDPAATQFTSGDLWLNNVTQVPTHTVPWTLSLQLPAPSGSALRLRISNCTYYGNVNLSASNFYVSGSSFFGTTNIFTKTLGGGSDGTYPPPNVQNTWNGGNTFNDPILGGTTTINNMHNSTLVLGGIQPDTFNGDLVLFCDQSSSHFRLADTGINHFKENISINLDAGTAANVQFGAGGGTAVLSGTVRQFISSNSTTSALPIPEFFRLKIDNAAGVELNRRILITTELDMTNGIITTFPANYVDFRDNATWINASAASYIDGFAYKTGNDAFVFPLGDNGNYRPLSMTAPANTASVFSARYVTGNHGLGVNMAAPLVKVSICEYWTFNRTTGADAVSVTLSWAQPFCGNEDYITQPANLAVTRWTGAQWSDLGNGGVTGTIVGNAGEGTVMTGAAVNVFGTYTLGSYTALNVLPIELVKFEATPEGAQVKIIWETASEKNSDHFIIERSSDLKNFEALTHIPGGGTTEEPRQYSWFDVSPLPGISYYRLAEVDLGGKFTPQAVRSVIRELEAPSLYPNPVRESIYLDRLNAPETSGITITDIQGRTWYSGIFVKKIDVESWRPGLYIVSVISGSKTHRYTFTKTP